MFKLYTYKISRRGKAAKGTVEVQGFGKPVLVDGVAKSFDYSDYAKADTMKLAQFLKDFGNVNIAMVQQISEWMMSQTMQQQNETAMLVSHILEQKLAKDTDEAKSVANAILSTRRNMVKLGLAESLIPSIDSMLESRADVVDKENKDNAKKPRLIRKRFVAPVETVETETPDTESVETVSDSPVDSPVDSPIQ